MMRTRDRLRGSRAARGFTLIEVLIALVVLLIGVYAMFAIFPRGYKALEASQQRTLGAQLAEAELARWKLNPESLPDQIVATDYNGEVITGTLVGTPASGSGPTRDPGSAASMLMRWDPNAMPLPLSSSYDFPTLTMAAFTRLDKTPGALYAPENLTSCSFEAVSGYRTSPTNPRPAALHPNWQPNSLYLPRTIIGEQIDVMRLGSQSAGVPFYLLSHAPLDLLRGDYTDKSRNTWVWMDVYDSRTWQYQQKDLALPVTLLSREFTYNTSTKKLYFGPMTNSTPDAGVLSRSFKLDYTDTDGVRIYGVTVTTDSAGTATLSKAPGNPLTLRVYEQLSAMSKINHDYYTDPNHPEQLIQWPRNAYYVDASTRVTGMIQFCPNLQTDPRSGDITLVKVDYRVQDWQILVFDVEVPPGGTVQLAVPHLKGPGFTSPPRQQRPQPVAKGVRQFWNAQGKNLVFRMESDPTSWAFLVAVDRQNGEILTDTEAIKTGGSLSTNAYERRTRVRVDYRNGALYFNYKLDEVAPNTWNADVDTPNRSGRTYRVFGRAEADWAVQLMPAARVYGRSLGLPGAAPIVGSTGALLTYSWRPNINKKQLYFPLSESGQTVAVDYYRKTDGVFVESEMHTIGGPSVVDLGVWVCGLSDGLFSEPDDKGPITVRGLSVRARAVWVGRGRRATMEDVAENLYNGGSGSPKQTLDEAWYQTILTTLIPRTPI